MRTLANRIAVVTGAGGGIGRAIAEALAAEGMRLALVDIDAERLDAVAQALDTPSSVHVADIADRDAVERLVTEVLAAHGAVHVLVNNAGVTAHGPFAQLSSDDLDWIVGINLRGVLHATHAFLPHLRASGAGHVVNVSSMAALVGFPLQATYSATKAAVRAFGEALRTELSQDGVGVSTVLPGTTATPFMARARSRHRSARGMGELMLRWGLSPDRVARAVVRGILHDRGEVFVGIDSHLLAFASRAWPRLLRGALGFAWARLGPDAERREP